MVKIRQVENSVYIALKLDHSIRMVDFGTSELIIGEEDAVELYTKLKAFFEEFHPDIAKES